jgi:hypothetical protein
MRPLVWRRDFNYAAANSCLGRPPVSASADQSAIRCCCQGASRCCSRSVQTSRRAAQRTGSSSAASAIAPPSRANASSSGSSSTCKKPSASLTQWAIRSRSVVALHFSRAPDRCRSSARRMSRQDARRISLQPRRPHAGGHGGRFFHCPGASWAIKRAQLRTSALAQAACAT